MSMPASPASGLCMTRARQKGATILKPLAPTAWGTVDFYLEDPEGYIIALGENETPG